MPGVLQMYQFENICVYKKYLLSAFCKILLFLSSGMPVFVV